MTSFEDGKTIFITEEEKDRIQNTAKEKVKKCTQFKDDSRKPRDPKPAISQAKGAALLADLNRPKEDKLPILIVGQQYPPCIVSHQELKPMKLAELLMDTHHRGRRLAVKRVSPVVILAARSWTIVQDETGDETERLEIYLHRSRHGEDVLETASSFMIKEPYFTLNDQCEATLQIDHPSDLIVCGDEIATSSQSRVNQVNFHAEEATTKIEKIARTCKDKGNAALKQEDLPLAHAKYTEGRKIAIQYGLSETTPDLVQDISRNRAHVNLLLGQLDEAKSDAKASLIDRVDHRSKELDSKAYLRAGRGAYSLGEYQEAKYLFEKQETLTSENKDTSTSLRKIEMRLREQEMGTYNLRKIRAGISRARSRVEAASFMNKTKVGDSIGRGRGLFATRDISTEDIIMCEKAFCVVWGHERGSYSNDVRFA